MGCLNNYVPDYVPSELPLYDRDRLMMQQVQRKCEEFLKNPQEHFEKTKIVNFDIIKRQTRGAKIHEKLYKEQQTLQEKKVSQYPKKERQNFLSCAFRTNRPNIYFEKKKNGA